jgi:hypothetical protein
VTAAQEVLLVDAFLAELSEPFVEEESDELVESEPFEELDSEPPPSDPFFLAPFDDPRLSVL